MTTKKQIPENILAAIESNKDSLAALVKYSWEGSKSDDMTPIEHFCVFQLGLMEFLQTMDTKMAFNFTLGLLAEHLLPLLTDEEREALRNDRINEPRTEDKGRTRR